MFTKKRVFTLAVALLLILSVGLSGCSKSAPTTEPPQEKAAAEQKLSWSGQAEPKTLDPQMSDGIPELILELAMFEGLTRLDKDNVPQAGIAEKWDVSSDGLKYTFHLRDSKWSNGDPITAEDFKYAWIRGLDPANGSTYAYQLYYIKNGKQFNTKEAKAEDLGIKVLDPKTLEVTMESPTPYFLSLTAYPTYFPVNKKVVDQNAKDWALKPETYISNGPFKMLSWSHKDKLVVVKNDNYWDAKSVKLSQITFPLIEDIKSDLNAFEQGTLDGTATVPLEDIDRMRQNKILLSSPSLATYFYRFNVTKKPFDNAKVRKALSLVIDRKTLIDKVIKGGQTPALAFVPGGIPDAEAGKGFRQVGGDYYKDNDLTEAKKLLADAGYPDGKDFPEVTLLYNTSSGHQKIAEAIQDMWKQNLGITVKLRQEEWKVYLNSQEKLQYDISRAGWVGDYIDPMTFMDMFVTGGDQNQTGWGNKEYDSLIDTAKKSGDQKVRMEALHKAEKILTDEMPIMPIYFYVDTWVQKSYVKDVHRSSLSFFDFKYAWVAEKK